MSHRPARLVAALAALLLTGAGTNALSGPAVAAETVATQISFICYTPTVYTGSPIRPCEANVYAPGLNEKVPAVYTNNTNAGRATVSASFAGRDGFGPSTDQLSFTIEPAVADVDLACPEVVGYTGNAVTPCTAKVTGPNGLSSSVTVSYRDNTGPGEAFASASYTAPNYAAAGVSRSFLIGVPTKVALTCTSGAVYTGAPLTACTAKATSLQSAHTLDRAVDVTYADNVSAGTARATASYTYAAGDSTVAFLPSSDTKTFVIARAPTTVGVSCPATAVYTGEPITPACTATATGAGGLSATLPLTFADNTDAGTATASATYAGDANHLAANGSGSFTITKAVSTVSVSCPASREFTGSPVTPACTATATGAGGLSVPVPVTFSDNVYAGTATATATYPGDANHLAASGSTTFQVIGFTLRGYYQPVDMSTSSSLVWNTVKGGSTVPLKFEAFRADGNEIASTTTLGATFAATPVSCVATSVTDDIEITTTGGTDFRYDGGQFIQNWKTPKNAGGCYRVTTTTADRSTLSAYFLLR